MAKSKTLQAIVEIAGTISPTLGKSIEQATGKLNGLKLGAIGVGVATGATFAAMSKAVIEGGLETRPDNVLIYATSNRRHLIKETWNDQHDLDLEKHHSDTVEEKLSLVARFGVTINFSTPAQKEYFHIVKELASRYPEITLTEEELVDQANKWEMTHGGMSGRTAQQFIDYLLGMCK